MHQSMLKVLTMIASWNGRRTSNSVETVTFFLLMPNCMLHFYLLGAETVTAGAEIARTNKYSLTWGGRNGKNGELQKKRRNGCNNHWRVESRQSINTSTATAYFPRDDQYLSFFSAVGTSGWPLAKCPPYSSVVTPRQQYVLQDWVR